MFISFHQRKETNQRNAAQGGEGLVQKKANMPHFSSLQHPLPLRNPSPAGFARSVGLSIG
jgi:hypothetical protein